MKRFNTIFLIIFFLNSLSNNLLANKIKIVFTTEIEPICGLEVLKSTGSINFKDSKNIDEAEFMIRTNYTNKSAKVRFNNISKSENIINEKGYFRINNQKKIYWSNQNKLVAKNAEIQRISANIDKNSNKIKVGEATVSTIIEINCE
jgi:hypothetical protein